MPKVKNCEITLKDFFSNFIVSEGLIFDVRSSVNSDDLNRNINQNSAKSGQYSIKIDLQKFANVSTNDKRKGSVSEKVVKRFICDICKTSFASKRNIRHHMENIHMNKIARQQPGSRKCRFCTKFILIENYRDHLRQKHKKRQCAICEKVYFNSKSLWFHNKTHEVLRYSCDICGHKSVTKQDLGRHILAVHLRSEPRTECEHCGKMITTRTLQVHIKHVHEDQRNFQCDVCDKRFHKSTGLRQHLAAVHLKQRDYVCAICDRKFARKSHLTEHLNGVHGAKPKLKCNKCQRTFVRSENLKKHLKSHEKHPFSCQKCTKMFETEMARYRHDAISHKNPKVMHSCGQCDKHYTTRHHLETHIRTQHLKLKFQCDHCGQEYTKKDRLKYHLLKQHATKP